MSRRNAINAQPLSAGERKALVAKVAETATGKARRGLAMIDFREPTARERTVADSLAGRARELLRGRRRAAA